jgi:hypothetical protein
MRRALVLAASGLVALMPVAPAGAASWTAPAMISRAGDVQFDLAMGAEGTAAIAWARDGVRVAVKRPGRPWGGPRRVSDGRFGVTRPAVTVTGRGEVVVAWAQNGNRTGRPGPVIGPLSIRARARGTSGSWGDIRQIGSTGHFVEAGIDLASNARGETIAVWRGVRRLSRTRRTEAVQSAFRRPRTAFAGTQTIREPESDRAGVTGQVVAVDERGTAYAAWNRGTGPVVRLAARTRGATGGWGAVRTLAPPPSSNPIIGVTPDRTLIVAWRAAHLDSEGDGIQSGALDLATRLPSGALTATQRLSDVPTRSYRIAVAPGGEAVLAWAANQNLESAPPGSLDLRVSTRPATGGPFGPPEVLPGVTPGDFHGGLAALQDGTVLFAWSVGGRSRVVARPPGATFSTAAELDVEGLYPLIASAGQRAVSVWSPVSGDQVGLAGSARLH